MSADTLKAFAALLAAADDNERAALLARVKLMAMQDAAPEAFEAPITTLGEYLARDIPVPPILVEPALVVRGGITCVVARAGFGKELPHSAKILTPSGWSTMGSIAVGDAVIDPDGGITRVVGKFPQGLKQAYTVTLSDGSNCKAGAEHLWQVRDRHQKSRLVTTLQLQSGFRIQTVKPFDFVDELERPLDPWVVGFLLGDGYLGGSTVAFSTADQDIVQRMRELLPSSTVRHIGAYDYGVKSGLVLDHIRTLKMNTTAHFKRVPPAYLRGTAESRLEVLRGLMDSDGCADGEFCSMSRGLVEDVIELVRSLGGRAALQCQRPATGAWRTHVALSQCPFWLPRKVKGWVPRPRLADGRYVRSVTLSDVVEQSCIKVASESGLFVTDDYIVTHNTQLSLNRILRWSAGKPMFDGLTTKDGTGILAPTKPLRSLIIENEGSAGMFQRQLGIMFNAQGYLTDEDRDAARENVLVWGDGGWSGLKLDDPAQLDMVRAGCEKWKPDIVFIEPFRGLWKGDENSATDMAVVADALSGVAAEYECGILIAHHQRKAGVGEDGEKMSAGRGSTVLEGVVATMENFEKAKGGDFRELSWSKVRHGGGHTLLPVRMVWDPSAWWYSFVPMDELEQTILSELADADPEPLTVKDLVERTDEKEHTLRRALKGLLEGEAPKIKKMSSTHTVNGSSGVRYRLVTPSTGDSSLDF